MGTLYVVGAPAGDPEDLTRRALRILRDVALVVTGDIVPIQRLFAYHGITTPLMAVEGDAPLDALARGDVALVLPGWSSGQGGSGSDLVRAAARRGFPVVAVPGPALAVTALLLSGFPADSFVCLGVLPEQGAPRRALLASIASESRTLVVAELASQLPAVLADLNMALGDRPVVVVAASEQGTEAIWRGTLGQVPRQLGQELPLNWCALVVARSQEQSIRWDEDRLRAEIVSLRAQGLGSREIGQKLAPESGWLRREIYRLAMNMARTDAGKGKEL